MTKYQINQLETTIKTKIDYAKELNHEQLAVVKHGEGPCLVLAGAGSGKTRTLVYRVAYLLEHGVKARNILLMTFTNKAAKEMLNRVGALLKTETRGLWGGTFHHVANAVLRKYGRHLGYQPNFTILDSEDSQRAIKDCLNELGINNKDKRLPKANALHAVISYALNTQQGVAEGMNERFRYLPAERLGEIERLAAAYQQKKLKMNAMDFDDLLVNWLRLLKEAPTVKEMLSHQWQYILVDEYQDTNALQGEIVNLLAGKNGNILVVGDDAQSIYSFRGADVNNILNFPKEHTACRTCRLETNYRSTAPILDLANASIVNNQFQFEKNLRGVKPGKERPALVPVNNAESQAEFIAQRVLELEDEGAPLNELAVLFRAAYQVIELELELNKRNIPYVVRGGLRFFEQAHVKDVVSWLKIVHNINDELAWKRVFLMMPGIGLATAEHVWRQVREVKNASGVGPLLANLAAGQKIKAGLTRVAELYARLVGQSFSDGRLPVQKLPAEALTLVTENFYQEYVKQSFENPEDRLKDLEQLAKFAAGYQTLADFLTDTSLAEGFKGETTVSRQAEKNDAQALILSTIHQAKGLEWRAVFIIGLVDGQFPHSKVFDRPEEMEEERRLFYVAATRAKEQLYCLYPLMTEGYGSGSGINRPSTFITEVDESLFDRWEVEGTYDLPTTNFLDV